MADILQPTDAWSRLIQKSLYTRLDDKKFEEYAKFLYEESPLPSAAISQILLQPHERRKHGYRDPRLPRYVAILLRLGHVNEADVLRVLLQYSRLREGGSGGRTATTAKDGGGSAEERMYNSLDLDDLVLDRVARRVATTHQNLSKRDLWNITVALTEWMRLVVEMGNREVLEGISPGLNATQERINLVVSLGMLVTNTVEALKSKMGPNATELPGPGGKQT
jgi:hypothetical protein